jgi:hypothetical protein
VWLKKKVQQRLVEHTKPQHKGEIGWRFQYVLAAGSGLGGRQSAF